MPRYLRLGFVYGEITRELLEDDEFWEKAKDLPIDPNNWVDCANRALREGASKEELIERLREGLNKRLFPI